MSSIIEKLNKLRQKPLHEAIKLLDQKCGLAFFERMLFVHWLNPFATLYINLRCFPLHQAIHLPLWAYGRPTIYGLSGSMRIEGCSVRTGLVRFNRTMAGAPSNMSVQSELSVSGRIVFHGNAFIGCGTKIAVAGEMNIGADTKITDFVNVGCFRRIDIGERSRIVHRCQLLDSNYHFVANMDKGIVLPWQKEIVIGKGVWVCNSTTVTGGAKIPDYCIVASNSLVGKDFSNAPEGSFICGIPAKVIPAKMVRINNVEWENTLNKWFVEHDESEPFKLPEEITMEELNSINCNMFKINKLAGGGKRHRLYFSRLTQRIACCNNLNIKPAA